MAVGFLTLQEYWEIERNTDVKWELWDGRACEMTDFSLNHVLISGNVVCALAGQLRRQPCQPFISRQRYKIPATANYFYPDCSVVCPPLEYDNEVPNTIINPRVLIEVLSPSSERKDRVAKWFAYQRIESLTDYLLISQSERRVEHYSRDERGGWKYQTLAGEGEIVLASIDCKLALSEIYERVEL